MKKLIAIVLIFSFVACGKKEWSKDYLVKRCNKDFRKEEQLKNLTDQQLSDICDCVADKAMAKYKSEAEMSKDDAGQNQIGQECATQVLMPQQQIPQ